MLIRKPKGDSNDARVNGFSAASRKKSFAGGIETKLFGQPDGGSFRLSD